VNEVGRLLANKVVVIVGARGRLGGCFCEAVAKESGVAVLADLDLSATQQCAEKLALRYPGQSFAVEMDITERNSINASISDINRQFGSIDAVVNSAYPRNKNYGRKMEDVTYSDFCENLGMHLGGYFLVAQQFAALFRAQGKGNIVNVSSIYGVIAPRFEIYDSTMTMPVEYAAIKSGLIHLTRYFAKYLKGTGIRVNAISPGGIFDHQPDEFVRNYNAMSLSKGMLDGGDISGALIFLLSELSSYVNGQNIVVDDGFSL
jgi:NAD(P)-dependent dehydrogenase (short-subunit alcohol dehydrogenase family)